MPIDRTRRFSLPGIHDLNKDQDEALALPMEGPHLIIGGPGTGKSVVALLRARRLNKAKKAYDVLVYNHLLRHSNQHLFGNDMPFSVMTWERWFRNYFKERFSTDIPKLGPEHSTGYRAIDWKTVEQQVRALEVTENQSDRFLVLDEGQDMPSAFYRTLIHLGFENFYVAADQNQQIHPEKCSSRQDIEDALAIEPNETLELKTNYRNTHPIALLARHFCPADPASPRPDLPNPTSAAAIPELRTYDTKNTITLAEIADKILQLSDRDSRKLIGIIAPDDKARIKFVAALNAANPALDNEKPPIQTFSSRCRRPVFPDFGQGGLVVINAQACKGLEFDFAILVDIDQHQPKHPYTLKARFYVMVARAREKVILLRTGDSCPIVDELLPTDSSMLVRK